MHPGTPAILALAAIALPAAGARAQNCPPGVFDYGPALADRNAALIVLDHYTATDPLLPVPADYQRASRDVALIRAAIPALAQEEHATLWVPTDLIIRTQSPGAQPLVCANQFYQASLQPVFGDWWLVVFPRDVNIAAMTSVYMGVSGVEVAEPNHIGGPVFCADRWTYTAEASGTWRWSIVDLDPTGVSCRDDGTWSVSVTAAGAVTVACYANCDESTTAPALNVQDFGCFLSRYAAGDAYANCDGSVEPPKLNVQDFSCFLASYAAGCP